MSHRDDILLVSIVINGSGQDSGQVEYNIHGKEFEKAVLKLLRAVAITEEGIRKNEVRIRRTD